MAESTIKENFERLPQLAARLQLSTTTIWRMRRAGRFPPPVSTGVSGKAVRWRRSDVDAWLSEQPLKHLGPESPLSAAAAAIGAADALLGEHRDRWITAVEYGAKYSASKNTMQKWMRAGLVDFVRVRCPGDRRDTIRVRDLPPGRLQNESFESMRVNLQATG